MLIQRLLAKHIRDLLSVFPVVAITGPRQSGKTTLAKMLLEQLRVPTVFLDLESYEDTAKLRFPAPYLRSVAGQTVFLDEVQRMPELFPLIRTLVDAESRPGRFILLGSASPALLLKSAESLAGRVVYVELAPLSLEETGVSDFARHWFLGGYPKAFLMADDASSRTWLNGFIRTYIERDLPMLGLSAAPMQTRNLLSMCASIQGNLLNLSHLANSLGISSNTVSKYLDFLENSYFIRRLPPFYVNISKRLVKSPKLYVRDSGVFHALLGIPNIENLYGNALLGASWEAYVVEQILPALHESTQAYFYRTADGSEIDLVLAQGIKPIAAIEIKFSNDPNLGKGSFLAFDDLKTPHNFVVTPSSDEYLLKENITVCNIFTLPKRLRELGLLR